MTLHDLAKIATPVLVMLLLVRCAFTGEQTVWAEISYPVDRQAIKEVEGGKQKEANAAWWGFDEKNSAPALQAAIKSGARKVIVPNMGMPWVVDKTILLESNQELQLENGVVIAAKKEAFAGKWDCLFVAEGKKNIVINGYGATIMMRKSDYMRPPYDRAEWRHCLSILSSTNITINGLRIADSGGDGIYVGRSNKPGALPFSQDIRITDVACENNYRQGISVISVLNLLIENCRVADTAGTPPSAGIDFEPNGPGDQIVNGEIRDCVIERNAGNGVLIHLANLNSSSIPVSITITRSIIRENQGRVLSIKGFRGMSAAKSTIRFSDNVSSGPFALEPEDVVLINPK